MRLTNEKRSVDITAGADLSFVHLGITIQNMVKNFSIGGFSIAFYGVIIGIGMMCGILVAQSDAKRRGQDPELYVDFAIYGMLFAILGARIYYVVFQWGYYKDHLTEIINLRKGGLAIYGGIIAAVITLYVFAKKRKMSFFSMGDTAVLGLVTGQIIGRWGNFFNCEAFGGYTDSFLAMRIKRSIVSESMISQELIDNLIIENGIEYIQVHPTFLYEALWNIGVLLFMLWYRKRKTFDGEMMCIYFAGYGLGRAWIEGLRTASLMIPGTGLAVSQVLSIAMIAVSVSALVFFHKKKKGEREGNQ